MMMNKKCIIIIEILGMVILYVFVHSPYLQIVPPCWVFQTTGLLCPACGGTRCVLYLLKGDWVRAFFSHIVFFISILYIWMINIIYLINVNKKKKIGTWLYQKYWYTYIFAVILMIYTIMRNIL